MFSCMRMRRNKDSRYSADSCMFDYMQEWHHWRYTNGIPYQRSQTCRILHVWLATPSSKADENSSNKERSGAANVAHLSSCEFLERLGSRGTVRTFLGLLPPYSSSAQTINTTHEGKFTLWKPTWWPLVCYSTDIFRGCMQGHVAFLHLIQFYDHLLISILYYCSIYAFFSAFYLWRLCPFVFQMLLKCLNF